MSVRPEAKEIVQRIHCAAMKDPEFKYAYFIKDIHFINIKIVQYM